MNETTIDPSAADEGAAPQELERTEAEAPAADPTATAHEADGAGADGAAADGAAAEAGAEAVSGPAPDSADDDPADASERAADTEDSRATDGGAAGTSTADEEDAEEDAESDEERVRRLEEEGDIAADYLEELLDIADLDGDIDIDVDGDRASVEIRGADRLAELNRPKGELLDALQELARLAVQTRTGSRSRLMLDIGGFRAEHKGGLEELAATAISEAKESGQPVPLRPMNPFERKVVHDVAKREGLRSESDGDGKGRHVVIYPAS
jgi:spoIIIJ-associated protein